VCHPVFFEVGPDFRLVKARDAQRHVIHVSSGFPGRRPPEPAEGSCGVEQVDQSRAGPQLHEAERLEATFHPAAKHSAVEAQRPIEVPHAQDDVIDADDVDCTHKAGYYLAPGPPTAAAAQNGLDRGPATPHDARSSKEPMTKAIYERGVRPASEYGRRLVAAEPCPVCETHDVRVVYDVEGVASRLVTCEGCGTGRLSPLPSEAEVDSFYPEAYYGDPSAGKFRQPVEWLVRLIGARHVRFFLRDLPPAARVLDVGCGRGVLLREIAERGFEAHGVEANAAAAAGADPRAEIRIAPRLADAGYPTAFFDEVVIWHVLEHLREPRRTLEEVRRILRPAGRLVVAVPNFSSAQSRWAGSAWFHLDLPRHLFHFPLSALVKLLEQTGFAIESRHHFSLRQNPFGWIQSALNKSHSLPRNGLYGLFYDRAARNAGAGAFDLVTRVKLLAGGAVALAPALVLSLLEAWFRSGATVHVVAHVAPEARPSA